MKETVGYAGEIVCKTRKPDGTPKKLLEVSRLKAQGWAPRVGLREGIGRAYEAFLARGAAVVAGR